MTDVSGVTDNVTYAVAEGPDAVVVGNEQWESSEGVSGPDAARLDNHDAESAAQQVAVDEGDATLKGPDGSVWTQREVTFDRVNEDGSPALAGDGSPLAPTVMVKSYSEG